MKNDSNNKPLAGTAWAEEVWGESWSYIKTVVDTTREPFLILDHELRILAANESFYRVFQVSESDTENKLVYELGNGQWNIPSLRRLLENILPEVSFFKGFEVNHVFPMIGRKIMLLNARQIHKSGDATYPPLILLAIENISEMMLVAEKMAEKFAGNASEREYTMSNRTLQLETSIAGFKEEIKQLREDVEKLQR